LEALRIAIGSWQFWLSPSKTWRTQHMQRAARNPFLMPRAKAEASPKIFEGLTCFEVMGHICAIRAHTQELRPNDQTLQIFFTAFASEGNCHCRKSRRALFFYWRLRWLLKCQFRADPPKDCGACFLVPIAWRFFSKKYDLLYDAEDFRVVTLS
jgi:hypothetical protein